LQHNFYAPEMRLRIYLLVALAIAIKPLVIVAAARPVLASAGKRCGDAALNAYLDQAFDAQLSLSPQLMTRMGLKTRYAELDDYTYEGREKLIRLKEVQLVKLRNRCPLAQLSPTGRLSYRLFEREVRQQREELRWWWHRLPMGNFSSPFEPVNFLNQHRIGSVSEARAYIERLKDSERALAEIADKLREQSRRGISPPSSDFRPLLEAGARLLLGQPFSGPRDGMMLTYFRSQLSPLDLPEKTRAELLEDAEDALRGPFQRGVRDVLAALAAVQPREPRNHGAWSLPAGEQFYAAQLKYHTTTNLTANDVHRLALREASLIHGEMQELLRQAGFTGTVVDYLNDVRVSRSRVSFQAADVGLQLSTARQHLSSELQAAPRWFRTLPDGAIRVTASKAGPLSGTLASYAPAAPGGGHLTLSDPSDLPSFLLESVVYHEGVPGHHLQSSTARQIPGLPKFRKMGVLSPRYTAYVEGWALYAEWQGKEMGFYKDVYSELGMLSSRLWRAARAVADTGIHDRRWTREQSIDFLIQHTPISGAAAAAEIDRILSDPGQGTSYLIGYLHIREQRARAEEALGSQFDIRDFHSVVLGNGPVPLDVLDGLVQTYISQSKQHSST
jgi:uncharacterized protein (DUF885 family)